MSINNLILKVCILFENENEVCDKILLNEWSVKEMIIKVGIIGDFMPERPSHIATNLALFHAADCLGINIKLKWLPTKTLENDVEENIRKFDGLWCAPGEYESEKGALNAIQFARENDYPFIGTCGGFQFTVIEYARNKLGLEDVKHAEYSPNAKNLIITKLSCSLVGKTCKVFVDKNSMCYKFYNETEVMERFSCNFGINPYYRKMLEESGFKISGMDENNEVRILELPQNRFFIATLFQPQLSSLPQNPHKLILAYLENAVNFSKRNL